MRNHRFLEPKPSVVSGTRLAAWLLLALLPCVADAATPPGCMLARRTFTNASQTSIPAAAGVVTSSLEVHGLHGRIFDVVVRTSLEHPTPADLDVTLASPGGRVVTLTTDNGGAVANAFDGTVWTDRADPGGQVPYGANNGMVTDQTYEVGFPVSFLTPEEPLGAFAGDDPRGTWTLTISVDAAGAGGRLDGWSLDIRTRPEWFVDSLTSAAGASVAIPDGPAVVSSTIAIPGAALPRVLSSVQVIASIAHDDPPDLDVALSSPAGTIVTLTTDNGRASNPASFTQRIWRDDANPGGQVPYASNVGVTTDDPYIGSTPDGALTPEEPLSAFAGEDPTGDWTLTISDDEAQRGGNLVAWRLALQVAAECSSKGDFDRSRTDDLVLRRLSTNEHELWTMDGVERLARAPIAPSLASTQRVVASDEFLGGAARPDLVVQDLASGQVEFWNMNGATRVGSPVPLGGATPLPANWKLSAAGDFNHDGAADLVWRNVVSQKLVIWTLGEGDALTTDKTGAIVPSPDQAVHANWELVAALDFDHDNNRDLLWYNATSGKLVVWFMDDRVQRLSGSFTEPPSAGDANWRVVAGGDYGPPAAGDGNADIVWRNDTSGKLVVWHMNGANAPLARLAGAFVNPESPSPPLDWVVVAPR